MYFFYAGYYLLFLVIPLALVLAGKRRELQAVFSFMTFLYLSSFMLFFLFPAVGPNRIAELAASGQAQPAGYLFAWINQQVQAHRGIAGAAFPSSHVAGAFVWIFTALRYQRKLGYFLIPIPLGITVASVYLGLHHGLDPLFGILWAVICILLVLFILRRRGEDPQLFRKS
jgi:membrane-associated phospholipid phosphatase